MKSEGTTRREHSSQQTSENGYKRKVSQTYGTYFVVLAVVFLVLSLTMYVIPAGRYYRDAYESLKPMMIDTYSRWKESEDTGKALRNTSSTQETENDVLQEDERDKPESIDRIGLDKNLTQESELENRTRLVEAAFAPGPSEMEKDSKDYRLSKEMAEQFAKRSGYLNTTTDGKGVLVVTWANSHYHDFVRNWVHHLNATGCASYLVGAMDDELLMELTKAGIPAFSMSSGLTTKDFGWGSAQFHKMGREKISLIRTFVHWRQDVIISDVDTVWMKNPVEYVAQYPEADILTSSDHLSATARDGKLEFWPSAGSAANIGIMLFRAEASKLADEWMQVLEEDELIWDQHAFNMLFLKGAKALPNRKDRLFEAYEGSLKMGILPVTTFASGHTFFLQRLFEKYGLEPYVAHATFQFSGTPGKRHRFRENLLWEDPDEYFQHENGFVSIDNNVTLLLEATNHTKLNGTLEATLPHFNLVNSQLLNLRALFGISTVLNRAAILPPLWCAQDRWWAPHRGTIPGSELDLPFQCPADHILDLERMTATLEESDFGPAIEFREHSFLKNKKAKNLVESTLVIKTCTQDELKNHRIHCADGTNSPPIVKRNSIKLAPGLKDHQILAALSDVVSQYKVLTFTSPADLWSGFSVEHNSDRFRRRMNEYGSLWCCVDKNPGHIWYDFFWDEVPHVDRHQRVFSSAWTPVTGP